MSIDTLRAAILEAAIPDATNIVSILIEWATVTERWDITIIGADPDEYQEQGEFGARHRVTHIRVDGRTFAAITITGHEDESAESVLRAALDFVRTETPVPA